MSPSSRTWRDAPLLLVAVAAPLLVIACGEGLAVGGDGISSSSAPLTQEQVTPPGEACMPTGKHLEHTAVGCATCHQCAGTVSFDASRAGPQAAFDATTKTCSGVACHAVPAGTFTYYVWDWAIEDVVPITVPYGGSASTGAASWYAAPGTSCGGCHGYPPRYAGAAYAWHSGVHALNVPNGNACQLCHPDATGAYVYGGSPSYVGTSGGLISSCAPGTYCSAPGTITNGSLHGNGVVDVAAGWRPTCLHCH